MNGYDLTAVIFVMIILDSMWVNHCKARIVEAESKKEKEDEAD